MEKVKELSRTTWRLQNSYRDADCSMRNVVNKVEITGRGARWVLGAAGRPLCRVMVFKPLCSTSETDAEWYCM